MGIPQTLEFFRMRPFRERPFPRKIFPRKILSPLTDEIEMDAPKKTRPRKANFSLEELQILLQEIEFEKSVLFAPLGPNITQALKNEVWRTIALKVSACGVGERTLPDCREKWRALKSAVVDKESDARKTGGGPKKSKDVPFEDTVKRIIGEETALYSGIEGAVDDSYQHISSQSLSQGGSCEQSSSLPLSEPGCSSWAASTTGQSTPRSSATPSPSPLATLQAGTLIDVVDDGEAVYITIPAGQTNPEKDGNEQLPQAVPPKKRKKGPASASKMTVGKKTKTTQETTQDVHATADGLFQRSESNDTGTLWDQYLQSEIDKNKGQIKLMELMYRKTEAEIKKLAQESVSLVDKGTETSD